MTGLTKGDPALLARSKSRSKKSGIIIAEDFHNAIFFYSKLLNFSQARILPPICPRSKKSAAFLSAKKDSGTNAPKSYCRQQDVSPPAACSCLTKSTK